MCCSENLANGVNDNYCSIFLQSSSVSSSLRDLGKQIAGSKLPGRLAQRWHSSGTTLVQRWHNSSSPSSFPFPRRLRQQVAHPSTPDAIDLCLQAEEISRPQNPASYSRLWLPGSGDPRRDLDQNSVVRSRQRNVLNPGLKSHMAPPLTIDPDAVTLRYHRQARH